MCNVHTYVMRTCTCTCTCMQEHITKQTERCRGGKEELLKLNHENITKNYQKYFAIYLPNDNEQGMTVQVNTIKASPSQHC